MVENGKSEAIRRHGVAVINSQVESLNPDQERKRLEGIHGKVWNTQEVSQDFEILGFMAPFVVAKERKTGEKGSLYFQHAPRFYFGWTKT